MEIGCDGHGIGARSSTSPPNLAHTHLSRPECLRLPVNISAARQTPSIHDPPSQQAPGALRWCPATARRSGHSALTWVSTHRLQALRCRSQRTRLNWERMDRLATRWLPPARITHPWPSVRFDARIQQRGPARYTARWDLRAGRW